MDDPNARERTVRNCALKELPETVAGMNLDHFIVRQKRRLVEKYQHPKSWHRLDAATRDEFVEEVAPLPTAKRHRREEAKRFDLLMFSLELALLSGSKRFGTLRRQLLEIASGLEEQTANSGIAALAELIEAIQSDHMGGGDRSAAPARAHPNPDKNCIFIKMLLSNFRQLSFPHLQSLPTNPAIPVQSVARGDED